MVRLCGLVRGIPESPLLSESQAAANKTAGKRRRRKKSIPFFAYRKIDLKHCSALTDINYPPYIPLKSGIFKKLT
jgi:hypothetical protein